MSMSDPLADLLTRIRNALHAGFPSVECPASKLKEDVCRVLKDEGYIRAYSRTDDGKQGMLKIILKAFKILLADRKVRRVLVNIFGGILRCDVAAKGIIAAVKEKGIDIPLVIRMRGTNAEEGRRILADSGLKVIIANDLQEAAEKVVQTA